MILRLTSLLLLNTAALNAADPETSDVFAAGKDGYKSIRIPSVLTTKSGAVLAFAEGRKVHSDQAENDIVAKRSTDAGKTWSTLKVLHDDGANSLNNPTVVQEAASGRILLMYQRIPGHLKERSPNTAAGFEGPDIYRNLLMWSDDDGVTWSPPQDVTKSTKRPTGATTICSGPGIGIQLTRGPHKGRIIFPFNEGPYHLWNNFAVFSDDGGKSWACGENVPDAFLTDSKGAQRSQINEVQMAELSDGSVRLNSRQFAGAKVRKTSVSKDGGVTWSKVEDVRELPEPSCMASILRHSFAGEGGKSVLLFSGPLGAKREHGNIHVSFHEGQTWPVRRELLAGSFGYSVLTKLGDGTIGCLYETDGANRIVFARFSLEWILEPPK